MRVFRSAQVRRWSLVLLVFGLTMIGTPAQALQTGGLGGRPANPNPDNPRTQSIFIYSLATGGEKQDQVLVSNNSQQPQTIELAGVDGVTTNTGAYTCKQNSEAKQDAGGWIQLDKSEVTLAPGQSEAVGFTLKVPDTADVGEHNGCITFQSKTDQDQDSGGVRILTRQAIRVVTTIPGDLKRELSISTFKFEQLTNGQRYTLDIKNDGNVSADVDTSVKLRNIFGGTVAENGGQYPVLPGKTLELVFTTQHMPLFGGSYTAVASIKYPKQVQEIGSAVAEDGYIEKSSGSISVFLWPQPLGWLLIIGVALLIATVLVVALKRRAKSRDLHLKAEDYTVRSGDSIETIAANQGSQWQEIAKLNKLSKPYTLQPGQTIKIPSNRKKLKNQE